MTRFSLIRALVHYRRRAAAAVVVLAALLAAVFSVGVALHASVHAAEEESVRARNGFRAYAVQVIDPAATGTVVAFADAAPVWQRDAVLRGPDSQVTVTERVTADPELPLELLVRGVRARTPSEITLSTAAADALAVGIGGTVFLGDARLVATGLTSDPADRSDLTVTRVGTRDPTQASVWLTDHDPFASKELAPDLENGSLQGRTVARLARDVADRETDALLPRPLYLDLGLTVVDIVLVCGLLLALREMGGRTVRALSAAGMPRSAGWQVMSLAAVLLVAAGTLGGCLLGLGVVRVGKAFFSRRLEQSWTSVAVDPGPLVAYAIALPGLLGVVAAVAIRLEPVPTRRQLSVGHPAAVAGATTVAAVALSAAAFARVLPAWVVLLCGPLVVWGGSVGLRGLVRARGPATRTYLRRIGAPILAIGCGAALVAWAAGAYAAYGEREAEVSAVVSGAPQPAGSLLVDQVAQRDADRLMSTYRQLGGKDEEVFLLPSEVTTTARVTSPRVLSCMRASGTSNPFHLGSDCYPGGSASSINTIALSSTADGSGEADPSLLEGGQVALLRFGRSDDAQWTALTDARPQPRLGGNLPGLVVPRGGTVAQRLHLQPSGGTIVAFYDFSTLPPRAQAQFRARISATAPAAPVAEDGALDDPTHSVTGLVITLGSALVVSILVFGGEAVLLAQARARRSLLDVGAPLASRRRVAFLWVFSPAAAMVLAAVMSYAWARTISAPFSVSLRWAWLIPALAGLAACGHLGARFLRVPAHQQE